MADNVAAISLGHSSKGDPAVKTKVSISSKYRAAQNGSAAGWGWETGWAGTHPVSFHTDVTFEPRKAILALGKTG